MGNNLLVREISPSTHRIPRIAVGISRAFSAAIDAQRPVSQWHPTCSLRTCDCPLPRRQSFDFFAASQRRIVPARRVVNAVPPPLWLPSLLAGVWLGSPRRASDVGSDAAAPSTGALPPMVPNRASVRRGQASLLASIPTSTCTSPSLSIDSAPDSAPAASPPIEWDTRSWSHRHERSDPEAFGFEGTGSSGVAFGELRAPTGGTRRRSQPLRSTEATGSPEERHPGCRNRARTVLADSRLPCPGPPTARPRRRARSRQASSRSSVRIRFTAAATPAPPRRE